VEIMATTELLANLHLLPPGSWQVYLRQDEARAAR
jgi:hypothetical protein